MREMPEKQRRIDYDTYYLLIREVGFPARGRRNNLDEYAAEKWPDGSKPRDDDSKYAPRLTSRSISAAGRDGGCTVTLEYRGFRYTEETFSYGDPVKEITLARLGGSETYRGKSGDAWTGGKTFIVAEADEEAAVSALMESKFTYHSGFPAIPYDAVDVNESPLFPGWLVIRVKYSGPNYRDIYTPGKARIFKATRTTQKKISMSLDSTPKYIEATEKYTIGTPPNSQDVTLRFRPRVAGTNITETSVSEYIVTTAIPRSQLQANNSTVENLVGKVNNAPIALFNAATHEVKFKGQDDLERFVEGKDLDDIPVRYRFAKKPGGWDRTIEVLREKKVVVRKPIMVGDAFAAKGGGTTAVLADAKMRETYDWEIEGDPIEAIVVGEGDMSALLGSAEW